MVAIAKIIGTASIRLTLDNTGFTAAVRAAVKEAAAAARAKINVDVDKDGIRSKIEEAAGSTKKPKISFDFDEKFLAKVRELSSAINLIPRIAINVAGAATAITAIHGVIAAIGQLSGVMALLPAAALAGAAVFATLAVGLHGFKDALQVVGDTQAFNEAIKNFAPSAKESAKAIQGLQPAWKSLQLDVQQKLFEGLGSRISALGHSFLPVLKTGLGGIATELNGGVKLWADWANQGQQVNALQGILGNTRQLVAGLAPAGRDFAAALTDIASVGSDFLPGFGKGIAGAAASFRDFVAQAKESGALKNFIQTGLTAFKQLGTIIGNIIAIGGQLFSGLQTNGAGFLTTLVNLTGTVREFFSSLQGQQTLQSLGQVLATVSQTVGTVFNVALKAIGPIIVAIAPFIQQLVTAIGSTLVNAIQTVSPILLGLSRFFSENASTIVPFVVAIGGLIKVIGPLASVFQGVSNTVEFFGNVMKSNAAKTVAGWISAGAQATVSAAQIVAGWVSTAAASVANAAVIVAQWVAMGVQATINAAKIAAAWVAQKIEAAGALIAQIPAFATIVAGWIAMGAEALVQGARIAAAWLLSLGPIGIIIAAVVGLVAIIIANWDAIYNFIVSVGQKIGQFFTNLWNGITSFFVGAWNGIKSVVTDGISAVVGFFRELPGRVLSALGNVGSWLLNAGADLLRGLWNGIQNAAGWLWDKLKSWASGLVDKVLGFFGIHSPSRVFADIGGNLVSGLAKGISDMASVAIDAASELAQRVTDAALLDSSTLQMGNAGGVGILAPTGNSANAGNGASDASGTILNQYNIMQPGTDVKQFSQTVLQRGMSDYLNGASTLTVGRQGVQAGVNDQLVNGVTW